MVEQKCPECGHRMVRDVRSMPLEYGGLSSEVQMPGLYCTKCGEGLHSRKDATVSDRALYRMKAKAQGLLLPEQVRSIRKRLKLTQKDAGTIIGGGPKAFQKYESGRVLVSRAISSALLLLETKPELLAVLESHQENLPEPPANVMPVE